MAQIKQDNIVLDSFGNVDVAFYEAEARKMRSEAVYSGLSSAASFVSTRVANLIKAARQWADDSRTASRTA